MSAETVAMEDEDVGDLYVREIVSTPVVEVSSVAILAICMISPDAPPK